MYITIDDGRHSRIQQIHSLDELNGFSVLRLEELEASVKYYPFIILSGPPGSPEETARLTYHTYRQLRGRYLAAKGREGSRTSLLVASIDSRLRDCGM